MNGPRNQILAVPDRHGAPGRTMADIAAAIGGAFVAALILDPVDAAFAALWWLATMIVIRSDLERFIIPDEASGAIALLGLARVITHCMLDKSPFPATLDAVAMALAAGTLPLAIFWLVALGFKGLTGREGLGFGDVKLAGACGVWLGWGDQIAALELASLAGLAILLWQRRKGLEAAALPFGAFLAPAAWLSFVSGPALHGFVDLYV